MRGHPILVRFVGMLTFKRVQRVVPVACVMLQVLVQVLL